ncbi:hypothetical protein EVAR_47338_1 [Eumeta japonica]|uniref:Uncharacterized protein n=1 Tax=Eumeta variegata TaxID=151549 RepID=A0A4C1WWB5_EUMVA|nr:hypothetical protein EVAR_47338_1 [Eumeta japonica]
MFCFDTTAVNTGLRAGACILLEQKIEKDALWLACRHHIMEIVLEAVVVQALGPSSGPEILIFKRFRSAWPSIDQRKFSIVSSDPDALRYVQNIADSTISFAKKQLNDYQPRDDYKELLTLTIIFLGGVPNKGISFRAPAGLHRARWMAKAIYCLKLFMFRDQFKMTKRELKAITELIAYHHGDFDKAVVPASLAQTYLVALHPRPVAGTAFVRARRGACSNVLKTEVRLLRLGPDSSTGRAREFSSKPVNSVNNKNQEFGAPQQVTYLSDIKVPSGDRKPNLFVLRRWAGRSGAFFVGGRGRLTQKQNKQNDILDRSYEGRNGYKMSSSRRERSERRRRMLAGSKENTSANYSAAVRAVRR